MVDYIAFTAAKYALPKPGPGAKMSGGDLPKWNADMKSWLEGEISVYNNPHYIYMDCDSFEVSGVINGKA